MAESSKKASNTPDEIAKEMQEDKETSRLYKVIMARSLALRFMDCHCSCLRAIPYQNDDETSITMCLYINTSANEIPTDLKKAAEEAFPDYNIEYVHLERRPLCKNVIPLESHKKNREKELADLADVIEENLDIFENRLNVTAVQPSYKIIDSQETPTVCVTVFLLGKGKIPLNEKDFSNVKELNHKPFDIVEGYFLPSLSSDTTLNGGEGIGVKDQPGAGTLGAFLQDENSNCYLLSCHHVLFSEQSDVIVQPAECDFEEEKEKLEKALDQMNSVLSRQKKAIEYLESSEDEEKKKQLEKRIGETSKKYNELDKQMKDLSDEGKPRDVGKFTCGLLRNIEFKDPTSGKCKRRFIDAAIAKLTDEEVSKIRLKKEVEEGEEERCLVYGFENNEGNVKGEIAAPTGEIVGWAEFSNPSREAEERFFTKLGRTTGRTDCGMIQTQRYFWNIEGFKKRTCYGQLRHYPHKYYCNNCKPQDADDDICITDISCLEKAICDSCSEEIKDNDKLMLWAYNCLTIQKKKNSFAEKGDSGSLVFDNQGRAWGIICGVFCPGNDCISVVTSLDVAIKELSKELKKNLHLWCVENTECPETQT